MTDGPGAGALGPKSSQLQRLRRLSGRRSERSAEGRFVVDGPTLLVEALAADLEVEVVFLEVGAPQRSADAAEAAAAAGIPIREVQPGALARVTSPVTPQGVAAVAVIPARPTSVPSGLVLVLVDVADPGNAGTLLRTAEATGTVSVVFAGDAVDPWNPKCVRASAGSVLRVPIVVARDPIEAVAAVRASGHRIVTTGLGGIPYDDADLSGDVAVLLGGEAAGLRPELLAGADLAVTIPMAGQVESLNVAMAGTVLAFAAASRRRRGDGVTTAPPVEVEVESSN